MLLDEARTIDEGGAPTWAPDERTRPLRDWRAVDRALRAIAGAPLEQVIVEALRRCLRPIARG